MVTNITETFVTTPLRKLDRLLSPRKPAEANKKRTDIIQNISALDRRDAEHLADQIMDTVIAALQRNPAVPARSFSDWSAALARTHQRCVELIHSRICGRVHLNEIIADIERWPW